MEARSSEATRIPDEGLPEFEVAWTFGGYTRVAARNAQDARTIFEGMDHAEILRDASLGDGLDIIDVSLI